MRLVVGESQAATPQAPPHRLVEGDTAPPQLMPLMPTSREVEGKSHTAPYPGQQMYTTQPQQTREPLKGQSDPLQARVVSARPAVSSPTSLLPMPGVRLLDLTGEMLTLLAALLHR